MGARKRNRRKRLNIPKGFLNIPDYGDGQYYINKKGVVYNAEQERTIKPTFLRRQIGYQLSRSGIGQRNYPAATLWRAAFLTEMPEPVKNRLQLFHHELCTLEKKADDTGRNDTAAPEADEDMPDYSEAYTDIQMPENITCLYCGCDIEDGYCPLCGVKIAYSRLGDCLI
jgi:hypothetical protein